MKSSAKKIELASVDDLFSTEESRQDATLERVQSTKDPIVISDCLKICVTVQ